MKTDLIGAKVRVGSTAATIRAAFVLPGMDGPRLTLWIAGEDGALRAVGADEVRIVDEDAIGGGA